MNTNGLANGMIAISPKKERIYFPSQSDAARTFGCSPALISRAKMYGRLVAGWRFIEDDGQPCDNREKVDLTSFARQREERESKPRRVRKAYDPDDDRRVDAIRKRLPGHRYSFGYLDEEYGPAICPVCHQRMDTRHQIKVGKKRVAAEKFHLAHCLKGRRLVRELGGIIRLDLDEKETGIIDYDNIFYNN